MRRGPRWAAAATAGALSLTACATAVTGHEVGSSAPATPGITGFPSSPSAAPGAHGATGASLTAALLAAADLPGFTAAPDFTLPSPLPCTPTSPTLEQQVPPAERAGVILTSSTRHASVDEVLYRFADAATATRFVAVGEHGFACTSATLAGQAAAISAQVTLSTTPPSDSAAAWNLVIGGSTYATAVLARVRTRVAAFTFAAVAAGRDELAPVSVVDLALTKLAEHS